MTKTIALFAVLGLIAGSQAAGAAPPQAFAIPGFKMQRPPLPAGEHKPFATYVNQLQANVSVPAATFVDLDQATLTCPKPTCTLSLSAMQQVGVAQGSGRWAINVNVDSTTVNGAAFQGFIPVSNFAVGNWQGSYTVTQGTHTVTLQAYGEVDYIVPFWSDTFTVMKP